jgi:serine phosphatase RsbU (regulator of sigma subunit)
MAKKFGIILIISFSIILGLIILFGHHLSKNIFFLSILFTVSLLPLGAALIPMSLSEKGKNKIKKIYLIVSLLLIFLGIISVYFEIPAAALELVVGVLWYCFAFAPLELQYKYLKWKPFSKSNFETILLSLVDFLGLNLIALGGLFKILYWPGSTYFLIIGGVTFFGGLVFSNYKFKKEVVVRKESEDQIREQHKEIKDSMEYAKRIQSAILPPSKIVKEYLKESFILYKPKDIVAGDFYWMEHKDGKVLFAAADCTGHGVPGALVSVICNGALNRSVREFELSEPGEVLDKARDIVIQEFEKSEEEVKDGMDIALCSLQGMKLQYAGAHNPLWILRKGEILETKANKQPIGKFDKQTAYTTHSFDLEVGDAIYIFSDGYVDQFGGEKGKKFKAKAFRNLLLSIQDKSMEEQKVIIDDSFESWRGYLEQIDDVCVIGVRV